MEKDFRVEVKNFGAVKDGIFDIKPLTVFIGDNDSGKSYISKFIYIVVKYLNNYNFSMMNHVNKEKYLNTNLLYDIEKHTKSLNIQSNLNTESQISFNLDDKFIKLFVEDVQDNFKRILQKAVEVYFSYNLNDLINLNHDEASINIYTEYTDINIKIKRNKEFELTISNLKLKDYRVNLFTRYTADLNESSSIGFDIKSNQILMDIIFTSSKITDERYLYDKVLDLLFFAQSSFINMPHSINYFPANKSGIMSNYNTKFQNTFISANDYIYNHENIKQDNYIINDFIKIIQNLSDENINKNNDLLSSYKYVRNKIDGTIYFTQNKMLQYKIGDEKSTLDIPIENISTKVTELTPIILYLAKINKKFFEYTTRFLIIEEPESHLNPKMQRMMARLLVMMMNEGIQILITTHSDYILNEMDILLKLNHIKEKNKKVFDTFMDDKDYESLMALDKENLSVYRFKKEGLDTEIEDIKITKNKVIEKEFEETSESLYLENSKVIEILKSI